jgi:hypothetical protein
MIAVALSRVAAMFSLMPEVVRDRGLVRESVDANRGDVAVELKGDVASTESDELEIVR